ncbi:MAG: class I SAM-dependent methyltransferase [Promethearchaeota archaeon]
MINTIFIKSYKKLIKLSVHSHLINQIISKNVFLRLLHYIAGINLKKESLKCKKLDDYINLAFSYQYSLFKWLPYKINLDIFQKKKEISELCKIISKIRAKIILEIGTAQGGTLFLLSKLANSDSVILSIALPSVGKDQGYFSYRIPFYKSFASNNQKIRLIRKNSHDPATLVKVKKILKEKEIDLLFIDGDHSYEGVKQDFEMYAPLVKKNGIIAFHDIVVIPSEQNCDVNKFWKEIKKIYDYKEFVEDWEQGNCGIGVIFNK